jgi:predicted Zn-dependent protease with MMP-like domain
MQSESTTVDAGGFHRRPRSRGVPAPGHSSRLGVPAPGHSSRLGLGSRLQLAWLTMYPLPRMLISIAVLLGAAYGVVAAVVLLPTNGARVLLFILPAVFIGLTVWCLRRGEPSDQVPVHHPGDSGARASAPPPQDDPQPADPDVPEPDAFAGPSPKEMTDADFDALEDRVDELNTELSTSAADATGEQEFTKLVRQAIDGLAPEFAQALDHVAVVVSNQGAVQRRNGKPRPLYGLYVGYGGRGSFLGAPRVGGAQPDRIVIFRDTLTRDFGSDPDRLREQVTRTLRHELAHHLGYDEPGVQALGL